VVGVEEFGSVLKCLGAENLTVGLVAIVYFGQKEGVGITSYRMYVYFLVY